MRAICGIAMLALGCGRIGFGAGKGPPEDASVAEPDTPSNAVSVSFGREDSTFPNATQDTFISDGNPNLNQGITVELSIDAAPNPENLLLRFDLATIPTTATVTLAKLTLTCTNPSAFARLQGFRLLQGWDEGSSDGTEGTANWLSPSPGAAWVGAGATGGSRATAPMLDVAQEFVDDEVYTFVLALADVQLWVLDPKENDGLVISQVDGNDGPAFASREDLRDSYRPLLDITYTP